MLTIQKPGAVKRGAALLGLFIGAQASAQELSAIGPLDPSEPITYFIADGIDGSDFRDGDQDLALWALEAWERSAGGTLNFIPGPEETALVRVYFVPAGFGQYGEMRPFLIKGRRGAAVYIRPDFSALGPEIATMASRDPLFRDTIVYLTCLHELGHAIGLSHTSNYNDIMYAFGYGGDIPGFFGRYRDRLGARDDMRGHAGIGSGDLEQLNSLYR